MRRLLDRHAILTGWLALWAVVLGAECLRGVVT